MKATKICAQCGDPFTPKNVKGKYCKPSCQKAAKREADKKTDNEPEYVSAGTGKIVNTETGEIVGREDEYDIEANYAKFAAMGLEKVDWVTTGIPEFDTLTRIPKGRVTHIYGPYGVGKTTLCLNMIRGLGGQRVLYIDAEASLNPALLVDLRINPETFRLYNDSAFIEDIYDTLLRALDPTKPPQFDLIILDSLAATTFRTEAAGAPDDANVGQKAKIMAKLFRVIPMELKRTNTALVVINQERVSFQSYGDPFYTPGGDTIRSVASLMIRLKTTKAARFPTTGPPFKGHTVTAQITKSKVNDPWRTAEFKLYYPQEHA